MGYQCGRCSTAPLRRSRHGVHTAVAAWAAAQQPPQGEPAAADAAVSGHGLGGVLRATGLKTARAGQVGADLLLVHTDGSEQAATGVREAFRSESWAMPVPVHQCGEKLGE